MTLLQRGELRPCLGLQSACGGELLRMFFCSIVINHDVGSQLGRVLSIEYRALSSERTGNWELATGNWLLGTRYT